MLTAERVFDHHGSLYRTRFDRERATESELGKVAALFLYTAAVDEGDLKRAQCTRS